MQVKCTIPVAVSIILSLKWGILCAEEHQFYFLFQWAWSFFCCHWICFIVGTANDNKVHIHVKLRNHYTWQTWTFNLWIKIQIMVIFIQSNLEGTKYCRSVPSLDCHTAASCRDLGFWNHFSSRTHSGTFLVRNYQPGLCWSKRRREKHRSNYCVSARKAFPHLAYHRPPPAV